MPIEFLQEKLEATSLRNDLNQGSFWLRGKGQFTMGHLRNGLRVRSFQLVSPLLTECCAEYYSDKLPFKYTLAPGSQPTTHLAGRQGESRDDLDNEHSIGENQAAKGSYARVSVCVTAEGFQEVGNEGA